MNLITKAALILILAIQSVASLAAPIMPAMQLTSTPTMYAVSGILRSTADSDIIQVVQGFVVAASMDEAVKVFSREALVKYPGRSVMDAVATPLPIPKSTCGLSI